MPSFHDKITEHNWRNSIGEDRWKPADKYLEVLSIFGVSEEVVEQMNRSLLQHIIDSDDGDSYLAELVSIVSELIRIFREDGKAWSQGEPASDGCYHPSIPASYLKTVRDTATEFESSLANNALYNLFRPD